MIQPLQEIAHFIEKKHAVKIIITKGGSGNLYRSLHVSQVGDLYLPGAESYINTVKNNPKQLSNELAQLTDKSINVVIGSSDSGSIGQETKKYLKKQLSIKKC